MPKSASRSEEIRNQVSFVNYDLQQKGFSTLRATSVEDEFIVDQVQSSSFKELIAIVGYHGFDVIP